MKYENPQLTLAFSDDEKRQLEVDRLHWSKRLAALATELEREPARIREVYKLRASRLKPVGLVYLWPVMR